LVPAIVLLTLGLAVLVGVALVAALAGTSSYGGKFLTVSETDLFATAFNLIVLLSSGGVVLVLALVTALLDRTRRRLSCNDARAWVWGIGLFALVVAPQLLLYREGGGFAYGRYILPAGLAIAIGLSGAITWLGQGRRIVWA